MKAFIYLSVLLITAGSAFGLADYMKEKKKGTLDHLYSDEPAGKDDAQPAARLAEAPQPPPPPVYSTNDRDGKGASATVAGKKAGKKKKAVRVSLIEKFSRARPMPAEELKNPLPEATALPLVEPVKPAVKEETPAAVAIEPPAEPATVKKPRLSQLFSRAAPLRVKKKAAEPPVVAQE